MNSLLVLIDHKNLAASGRRLIDILPQWLSSLPETEQHGPVIDIGVRVYGGWYHETSHTDERSEAIVYYQNELPSLFSVKNRYFRTHLTFAETLLDSPTAKESSQSISITHTTALRPAELISVVRKGIPACTVPTCRIGEVRRWVRRRKACLEAGCPSSYSDVFERREQKQVDVHIAVDLLLAAQGANSVALVTADNDLIPAILAFRLNAKASSLLWVRPKGSSSYLDNALNVLGVSILNL